MFPIFSIRYVNDLVGIGCDGICQAISSIWNMLIRDFLNSHPPADEGLQATAYHFSISPFLDSH